MLCRSDESGATAIEYAIMVSLIAAVIIVAVVALGLKTEAKYDCSKDAIANPATFPGGSC